VHVHRGGAARLDRVVERHGVLAPSGHRELRGRYSLYGAERVALNARDLHQTAEWIACEAEVVSEVSNQGRPGRDPVETMNYAENDDG